MDAAQLCMFKMYKKMSCLYNIHEHLNVAVYEYGSKMGLKSV